MSISITKNTTTPTNLTALGFKKPAHKDLSPYDFFHFTFLGYNFYCNQTDKVMRKSEFFLLDPMKAINIARSLMLPSDYTLIDYTPNLIPVNFE